MNITSKTTRMICTTAFSLFLVIGAVSAVSANVELKAKKTEGVGMHPSSITGNWELRLEGGQTTYTSILTITRGSGNLKLQAKNTGSHSFKVTLQSTDYPKYGVILGKTVKAGETLDWTKNGGGVPSGSYILQVHGSEANPKGAVYLKSADKPW